MCRYCEPYDEEFWSREEIRRIVNEELDRREAEERQRSAEVSRRMQERIERFNEFDTNEFVFLREERPSDRWEPELPAEPSKPRTDDIKRDIGTVIDSGEDEQGFWFTVKLHENDVWRHRCEVRGGLRAYPNWSPTCHDCGVERP